MRRDTAGPIPEDFGRLVESYTAHSRSLRGIVRHEIIARQMALHLPSLPAQVVDVGGGSGEQALRLARRGYDVTVLEPSERMILELESNLRHEAEAIRSRIAVVRARDKDAPTLLGEGRFNVVLSHGVLMYLDSPTEHTQILARLAAEGAVLSIATKNAAALAMRPALAGNYREALDLLDTDRSLGRLGVTTRGDTLKSVEALLQAVGVAVVGRYGVRIFTDHLLATQPVADIGAVLDLEFEGGQREPYLRLGRLFHVVGLKRSK